MSWMRRLTFLPFLLLSLAINLGTIESAFAQSQGMTDSDLPAAIRTLRDEIVTLQSELSNYVAGLQSAEKVRRGKSFEAYQKQFQTLGSRISDCRERLQYFHEQVSRLYRTMPTSSLYLAARQAYADAKQDFDALVSNFSSSPRPETLQVTEVRVTDGRLVKHLAQTDPVKSEQSIGQAILEADDIRYVGKFDSVEVYLVITKDTAHYLLTGLREQTIEADGRISEIVHSAILCSDPFPSRQAVERQTTQHFDSILQQKFILLAEEQAVTDQIRDELRKARSYARVE
ncbi:MAG: hypothetical protein ACUVR8_10300 [Acidobacteriota bacterium]